MVMKKKILVVCSIVVLLLGGTGLAIFFVSQEAAEPPIDWNNLSPELEKQLISFLAPVSDIDFDNPWWLEGYPTNIVVAPIENEEEAIERAMEIWAEMFSEQFMQGSTASGLQVFYDKENDLWFLSGILPPNRLGMLPFIFIRGSGEVVAVWRW